MIEKVGSFTPATQLFSVVASTDSRNAIELSLKLIAMEFRAEACVLWTLRPQPSRPPKHSRDLFALATWSAGDSSDGLRGVLSGDSAAGKAIVERRLVHVSDLAETENAERQLPFVQRSGVRSLMVVPVDLFDQEASSLCVYRISSEFSDDEQAALVRAAAHLPLLYQSLSDRAALSLLRRVNKEISEAEHRLFDPVVVAKQMQAEIRTAGTSPDFLAALQKLTELVTDRMQCVETSIFLEDSPEGKSYSLAATTWPSRIEKHSYSASVRDGITGWVLERRKPVRIFDLANFHNDKSFLGEHFPELEWHDSLSIEREVRKLWKWEDGIPIPPLGWIGVPIAAEDRVIGMLRCCAARSSPHYFSDADRALLELIADQISRFWSAVTLSIESANESRQWRSLVESVGQLNASVRKLLGSEVQDEGQLLKRALEITGSAIPGAHSTDVRLYDQDRKDLYFAATDGAPWDAESTTLNNARRAKRFPVDPIKPSSLGASVFLTQKAIARHDVKSDPLYSETFPDAEAIIVAPVSLEDQRYGVLDIRFATSSEFPRHAEPLAQLLGVQLGLYHFIAATSSQLLRVEQVLNKTLSSQRQAFEDFYHQLNRPTRMALQRATTHAARFGQEDPARRDSLVLRGLSGKAYRVARSIGMFTTLAKGSPIRAKLTELTKDWIVRLLVEAAIDYELMMDPNRNIRIDVDRESFEELGEISLLGDRELVEQSINILLDNATKYSYSHTRITIRGGAVSSDRFGIAVLNVGLRLNANQARLASQREWRGRMARMVSSEGMGIGLWLADNMMSAQSGALIVHPTLDDGTTVVLLAFPVERRR